MVSKSVGSITPIEPTPTLPLYFHIKIFFSLILAIVDNAESRYRNILSFKVDEKEIMLAVDNGNIEIYDRSSMKLTCLFVGQYSASPVKVDFNAKLIFVQYTCAFWKRRQSPSAWWNIYCRYLCRYNVGFHEIRYIVF